MRRRKDDLIQETCEILLILSSIRIALFLSIFINRLEIFFFLIPLHFFYYLLRTSIVVFFYIILLKKLISHGFFLLPLFFFLFFCMHFMSLLMQFFAFALAIEADILKIYIYKNAKCNIKIEYMNMNAAAAPDVIKCVYQPTKKQTPEKKPQSDKKIPSLL